MNMETGNVMAPPAPKRLEQMQLPMVMMRDILLKTMFRKNLEMVTELSRAVCLPIPVTQELVDLARTQKLVEATGNEVPTLMDISAGETKEYYFGLFLMIYAWSLWRRREPVAEAAA